MEESKKRSNRYGLLFVAGVALVLCAASCQQPKETVQIGYHGEFSNRLKIDNSEYGFKLGVEMTGRLPLRKHRYEMWVSTDLFYPNISDKVILDASRMKLSLNGTPMIYLGKKGGWNINPVDETKRYSNTYEFTSPELSDTQMDSLLTFRHEFKLDLNCFININDKCVPVDSAVAFDPTIIP